MRRACLTLTPLLIIIFSWSLCLADGGTVFFIVDGETVAQLECQEFPMAKPIKLAGRSGGSGCYQRSGLIDNVYVELGETGVVCNEDFQCFEVGGWVLYGEPSPVILLDFGNPLPCLMTSGDSWYDSGICSEALYNWSAGFHFAAYAHVDQQAAFHSVEMGIADQDAPTDEGIGHVIGVNWKTSGQGDYILQLDTDIETVQVPAPSCGQWHWIEIIGIPTTSVESTDWGSIKALYR
ncbi:MAG: hypothetical protein ABIB97_02755 [Patescibacteria group bacterium]